MVYLKFGHELHSNVYSHSYLLFFGVERSRSGVNYSLIVQKFKVYYTLTLQFRASIQ